MRKNIALTLIVALSSQLFAYQDSTLEKASVLADQIKSEVPEVVTKTTYISEPVISSTRSITITTSTIDGIPIARTYTADELPPNAIVIKDTPKPKKKKVKKHKHKKAKHRKKKYYKKRKQNIDDIQFADTLPSNNHYDDNFNTKNSLPSRPSAKQAQSRIDLDNIPLAKTYSLDEEIPTEIVRAQINPASTTPAKRTVQTVQTQKYPAATSKPVEVVKYTAQNIKAATVETYHTDETVKEAALMSQGDDVAKLKVAVYKLIKEVNLLKKKIGE